MERQDKKKSIEEMLNECSKWKGNPVVLIHRTIHSFNNFLQNLIFDKEKIINDDYFPLSDEDLIKRIKEFQYDEDDHKTLYKETKLYYDYCRVIYDVV